MKKQPWLFLIGLLLAGGSHSVLANRSAAEPASASELPRGNAQSPAYPKEWAEFKGKMEKVHQAFEAHIKGAKNISIPIAPKEFRWQVDWARQQAYCKRIAEAIFSKPRKAQIVWPNAVAARDGVEPVYDAIGKTFPKCQAPKPTTDEILRLMSLGLPDPLNRGYLLTDQNIWRKEAWTNGAHRHSLVLSYFTGPNYLIDFFFYEPDEPSNSEGSRRVKTPTPLTPRIQWGSHYDEDDATGCPRRGSLFGPGHDPTNAQGYITELPTVFLHFEGELLPVEFGRYQYGGQGEDAAVTSDWDRWGKRGQKFLFVKAMSHGLWLDWAISPLPEDFSIDEVAEKGITRACVFNFDTPE